MLFSLEEIRTKASSRKEETSPELVEDLECLLREALATSEVSLSASLFGSSQVIRVSVCLRETLSAMSLMMDLDRVDFSTAAGTSEISGDPLLFGILVEKLIFLAMASLGEGPGRILLSAGLFTSDGETKFYLEVADSAGLRDWHRGVGSGNAAAFHLDKLAREFSAKISSLYESGRGTTVRLVFPLHSSR